MYALRILVAHGLTGPQLYDVVRATTVARLLYAAPAWWGFAGQQDRNRLQSVKTNKQANPPPVPS